MEKKKQSSYGNNATEIDSHKNVHSVVSSSKQLNKKLSVVKIITQSSRMN